MYELMKTDVLIVGGGGAACRAAIAACDSGAQTLMVMKGKLGSSGTTVYKVAEIAGFNVPDGAQDPDDNPDEHLKDILDAGLGMTDEALARILVEEAEEAKETLEKWGMSFEHNRDGSYLSVTGCFSTRPRMHIIKGHGEPIVKTLLKEIRKREIRILDSIMLTDLLIQNGQCIGAVGIRESDGKEVVIEAKATVLATGGAGRLFKNNLNPPDVTGDGHAMAYRAGADLINMEFMQVGIGFAKPVKNMFNAWLWMAYPDLCNRHGEKFLDSYLPKGISKEQAMDEKTHFPFSSRDNSKYLEISVQKELRNGNGIDGNGIYVDFTHVNEEEINKHDDSNTLKQMWPLTRDWLMEQGLNLLEQPAVVTTYAHALNGGLRINDKARTSIPGLYAAGEVAGGPHGADRLGGNMMITTQVFGKRAGIHAAQFAKETSSIKPSENLISSLFSRVRSQRKNGKLRPEVLKDDLAEVMWRNMIVVRSEEMMAKTEEKVREIRNNLCLVDVRGSQDLREVLELDNLLTVAEIIINAARERRESRGSHYREDFPQVNERYGRPYVVNKDKDGMRIRFA